MATETGTPAVRSGYGSGDRLPVAPRQRRPALAALALLLILGGGLISAVLVVRSGQKEAIIALRQDVAAGHVITDADLISVPAALPDGYPAVPWDQRSRVIGRTASADLKKGTILNPRVAVQDPLPNPKQIGIPLLLKPDQITERMKPGSHVTVLFAPTHADQGVIIPKGFTEKPGAVLYEDAIILTVSKLGTDGSMWIELVVPTDVSAGGADMVRLVTQLGRQQAVALLELPLGG